MSATEFIRLKKANCTNCYKCIRHCPVKAIRFSGGQAHIIQDACIYCGECFVICPQNAKWIYSETEAVKSFLLQNEVYVSLAPSFVSYFDTGISCMKDALKKLGFAGCEETAVGATIVKNAYEQLIQEGKKDVLISSCCHTVNLLIQKYYPDLLHCLAPVVSPMQAHCRKLKQEHPGCKTVFIGPCISKKDEAERYMEDVDAVMTFDELEVWFNEEKIVIPKDFEACEMSKTRLFPKAGGILKTMAKDQSEYVYLSVDGTDQCMAYLEDIRHGNIHHCFIEMSACKGSCIGGPLMIKRKEKILERNLQIERYAGDKDFVVAQPDKNTIHKEFENLEYSTFIPEEAEIRKVLLRMGKKKEEDELTFSFMTDNMAEIFISFEKDDILQSGIVYQFGISNPQGTKSPRDPKVRNTILAIIEEFFNKNKAALLYICETGDGMQKMRSRLFQYWFSIYNEREEYLFLPQIVYDEEENENYAALIIRKDNPCFVELVSEFTDTINLLNGKPE